LGSTHIARLRRAPIDVWHVQSKSDVWIPFSHLFVPYGDVRVDETLGEDAAEVRNGLAYVGGYPVAS
jgi:hypothetical protein